MDEVAAVQAWDALPRSARADVLALAKAGLPARDSQTVQTVVDWGRRYARTANARVLSGMAFFFSAFLLVITVAPLVPWLAGVALLGAVGSAVARLRPSRAIRVNYALVTAVNLEALARQRPAGPTRSMTATLVPRQRRRLWIALGTLGASVVAAVIAGLLYLNHGRAAQASVVFLFAGLVTFMVVAVSALVFAVLRYHRTGVTPTREVFTLDDAGLRVPAIAATIAWSNLTAAGFRPITPPSLGQLSVSFRIADPKAIVASSALPPRRLRLVQARVGRRELAFEIAAFDLDPVAVVVAARQRIAAAHPASADGTAVMPGPA